MPTRDWAKIRKLLRENYNPAVVSSFGSDTLSSSDTELKDVMTIQTTDSFLIANSRITLYNQKFTNSAIAAVPEWWQIRPESHRPQFVLMCAQLNDNKVVGDLVYPITVPHPVVKHLTTSPIPDYQKGNVEGILTLSDNSKVTVNAFDSDTATTVLEAIKKIINPDYLKKSFTKIGTRKGQQLLTIKVRCKQSIYFSTGLQNMKPDWIDKFT
ncbi:MAG: hypothetical protein V7K90_18780 [Nostoc sp.]|uniref:hypothetical protein n=1 Tax=Nostoc sp. TaxID=1180 RepID=UPI002FF508E3